ncbi:Ras-related and estrogen-regulated growth inhibitor, partial [Tinamus guttatus]
ALTVRFITRRFIGDYDPTLGGPQARRGAGAAGEVRPRAHPCWPRQEEDSLQLEEKIKWGEGFAVVYSVTDRCSFDEVLRLCFLVRHLHGGARRAGERPPVVLVANKKDLQGDRMVATAEGESLAKALELPFLEIS